MVTKLLDVNIVTKLLDVNMVPKLLDVYRKIGVLSPEVQWPEREAKHSSLVLKLRMRERTPQLPSCTLITQRDKFENLF
jgi:hypothetical protein